MATKSDLADWLIDALEAHAGAATIVQTAKHIWQNHQSDLEYSGDLFYTWQYDMRWAANYLRHRKIMKSVEISPKGMWELAPKTHWAAHA